MKSAVGWTHRWALQVIGWILLVAGIAALVLPGPGLLMMFLAMAILARENEWAERRLEPVKRRAFETAAEGVKTWPRIVASCLSALVVAGFGVLWILQPAAPGWWPLRDSWWLVGGWGAGISLVISAIIALVLIVYSYKKFRAAAVDGSVDEKAVARETASPDAS